MARSSVLLALVGAVGVAQAQCPFADVANLAARAEGASRGHLSEFEVDDSEGFLTSDVGGNIGDQESLRVGDRGSTLLEDFIFRQKITHFDHERVRATWQKASQTFFFFFFFFFLSSLCFFLVFLEFRPGFPVPVICNADAISSCRFPREPSMPAELVLTVPSPATVTIATSLAPRSWQRRAKRPPSSSAFLPLLAQGAVPTRQEMSMASRQDCEFVVTKRHIFRWSFIVQASIDHN
jgi:hypothetical protein